MDYLSSIDFPMRFTQDGNLELANNDRSIHNNILLCVFIFKRGLMLKTNIGSELVMSVFDPNDDVTNELIKSSVLESIRLNEQRVIVNPNFQFKTDNSGNIIDIMIQYAYKYSSKNWDTDNTNKIALDT